LYHRGQKFVFKGLFYATGVFITQDLSNYTKKELVMFGFSVGLATFIFFAIAVIALSLLKGTIPPLVVHGLNVLVGCLLIGYGSMRLAKSLKKGL